MRRILQKAWAPSQFLPARPSLLETCRINGGAARLLSQTPHAEETLGKLNLVDPAELSSSNKEERSNSGLSASTSAAPSTSTSADSPSNPTGTDPVDSGLVGDDGMAVGGAGGKTTEIRSPGVLTGQSGFQEVVVVGMARTPMGVFGGGLSSLSAPKLGGLAIKGALERANLQPEQVNEVIYGNVLQAGLGQAPARQAAMAAGLPASVICTTVNKMCASGMKAVMFGAQSIMLGHNDVVVAGGMESMSRAPYYVERRLRGKALGHQQMKDGMILDGLWDAYKDMHMGQIAELCASEMGISRSEQDDYAIQSYERALAAQAAGVLAKEIVPVSVPSERRKGEPTMVEQDEGLGKFDPEKLRELPPVFEGDGTVTAGNASQISDGAVALVLTSAAFAEKHDLKPILRISGFGDAAQSSEKFPTTPSLAIPRAVKNAGKRLEDVDLFEINQAFAVVQIANERLLGLSSDEVNIHGGAVALGHPIGASGARQIMALHSVLTAKDATIGCASICNGGGGASAIVIERL
ncbi:acetoacetyl-CoA thiolase [Klebsormidium nitens]|uniref:Acetoacetyl-CoA thiolase n=1 Tax=Klebsormidium nitens TaxID=105231 RepID=A0A1Y1IKJ7_KLENI|nr:acetoacetyl-CoA thiolase [Klebsormidium nitens]|eukprot:GAQ91294.1 acetoacetyl-CoA thiolase [Klebsormidium nitens]